MATQGEQHNPWSGLSGGGELGADTFLLTITSHTQGLAFQLPDRFPSSPSPSFRVPPPPTAPLYMHQLC